MQKTVQKLETVFAAVNANPRRTAEELLAHVLNCRPLEIYLHQAPTPEQQLQIDQLAERILNEEPLQYIVGHVDFHSLHLRCDPRALIPRPETEQLVDEVLHSVIMKKARPDIAEVGTGSGCIILALAAEHPRAEYTAVDISPAALELAKENAHLHNLHDAVRWREGSLLDGFPPQSLDAVISNPPYIATGAWEQLESCVRDHEPRNALDSGPGGMELIEELAAQARTVLRSGGMLFLEYGFDQGDAVRRCLEQNGFSDIRILKDYSGHDRMATATLPGC